MIKRKANFAAHSINKPKIPHDGQKLDLELDNLVDAINKSNGDLADIRRDDGRLKNGIVTADSLSAGLADSLSGDIASSLQPIKDHVTDQADKADVSADKAQTAASHAEAAKTKAQAASDQAAQSKKQAEQIKKQVKTDKDQITDLRQSAKDAAELSEQSAKAAESYQAGAKAAYADARAAADTAVDAVGPAASHLQDKNNPHGVTHAQVGSDKAHWNALRIMDKPVSVDNRKADGLQRVVVWDPAKDSYTHAVLSSMVGNGLNHPINWANEGDGRILVLRDDGNGGFVWRLEPKPQRGKKSVNDFVDLADTPAMIEAGKALIGHEENGLKSLIWTEIYGKADIDGLFVPVNSRLDQLLVLINTLRSEFNLKFDALTALINSMGTRLTQIENNYQQGGTGTNTTQQITKAQAANRWQVWAGF